MIDRALPPRVALAIRLFCSGKSVTEVAKDMGLARSTVSVYRSQAKNRLLAESFDEVCKTLESGDEPRAYLKRPSPVNVEPDRLNVKQPQTTVHPRWTRYPLPRDE
jgi:transposase-like protein